MADVFLSYVSEDRAVAEKISNALEASGISVWWDRQLHGGVDFAAEIERQLISSKAVIVLWSAISRTSEWVRDEAQQAHAANKLIPVRLDAAQPPLGFRQTQSLDFSHWNGEPKGEPFARLIASARQFLEPRVSDANRESSASPVRQRFVRRNHLLVIAALTVVAIGGFVGVTRWRNDGSEPPPSAGNTGADARVEVSPFEAIGSAPETRAFADALTAAVAGALSENMVQTFVRRQDASKPESASHSFDADLSFGGSVSELDDRISVRAFAADVASGVTVWSGEFERPRKEQSQLLSQVVANVADQVYTFNETRLQPGVHFDPQSLSIYMKLMDWMWVTMAVRDPRVLGEELVTRMPQSAAAHGLFAAALDGDSKEEIARSRAEAERAIQLYPPVGSAYNALYFVVTKEEPTNLVLAEAVVERGLSEAPRYTYLHLRRCQFLTQVGRVNEALRECETAVTLRPFSPPPVNFRSVALYYAGETDRAIAAADEAVSRRPDHIPAQLTQVYIHLFENRLDGTEPLLSDAPRRQQVMDLSEKYRRALETHAKADIDAAIESASDVERVKLLYPGLPALIAAKLRRVDTAFEQLSSLSPDLLNGFLFYPALKSVRDDPRFMQLVDRTGHIDYWRHANVWPDFCRAPSPPYDCEAEAQKVRPR